MSNEYLDIAMEKVIKQEVNAVLEQIGAEIAEIDDRNGWVPIDEVFDIILKYQKGGDK